MAIICSECGSHPSNPYKYCPKCNPEQDSPYRVSRLDDRGKTYGDYSKMSNIIQSIKANMRAGSMNDKLTHGQREALEMIATKIGRIVEGDPNHIDRWRDIAGSATVAAARIATAPAKKGDLK